MYYYWNNLDNLDTPGIVAMTKGSLWEAVVGSMGNQVQVYLDDRKIHTQ